ncbi:GNAT family N-acetyltransferase [Salinithrix halophila]|uniref:GNAT family N-acetyltransferase n=1 Tax=Salinithrix halophila TaxID=1485204 RepID=A0ABV8JDW3_9BACL
MAVDMKNVVKPFQWRRNFRIKGQAVTLRPANEDDAAELAQRLAKVVEEQVYLDQTPDKKPNKEDERAEIRKIQDNGGMYTVVEVDGKISGVALLIRGSEGVSHHTAKFRTWLVPGYRGTGLGKKLMEYTIEWASRKGIEKINLDVWSSNNRAIQLYKKYGFRLEGRRRRQAILKGKYVDEIFMSRFL